MFELEEEAAFSIQDEIPESSQYSNRGNVEWFGNKISISFKEFKEVGLKTWNIAGQ
jgi:hypothetical protein